MARVDQIAEIVESRIEAAYWQYRVPLIVSFSGGKDSAATLAAAYYALGNERVVGYFIHIPGQTVTDNVRAAKAVAERFGFVWESYVWEPGKPLPPETGTVFHVVPKSRPYWELLRERGPPAPPPHPRWCCRYFKEEPLSWAPCAPTRVDGRRRCVRIVVAGVKRADSQARARRWADGYIKTFKNGNYIDVAVSPLVDLTDEQVWQLLSYYGIDDLVRSQYEKWGRSPNCVLCPLASRAQLERAARLLPGSFLRRYLDALEPWVNRYPLARRMYSVISEVAGDDAGEA